MARLVAPFIKPVEKAQRRAAFAECIPPHLYFFNNKGIGRRLFVSAPLLFFVLRPEDAALLPILSVSLSFAGFVILWLGA